MGRSFFKKSIQERKEDRCARCGIRKPLCFCEHIPELRLDTRLVVVMHVAERNLTSNTARLATQALPNSEIRWRGKMEDREAKQGRAPAQAAAGDGDTLVLFPSDDAVELTPEFAVTLHRPVTLIVPDGSWRQARKVIHREPGLEHARRVKLPPGPPSEYRLRVEPNDHSVCTYEAIARALGVIEGLEVQSRLETLFRIMVGRMLWSRGMIAAQEVPEGIPVTAAKH